MLDENAYRQTYAQVNPLQCAFERALLRRCCGCEQVIRRNIAEREAAGCSDPAAQAQCAALKARLRHAAAFVLKLTDPEAPLPHAKELKLQCGGLLGLARLMDAGETTGVPNVYASVTAAVAKFGSLDTLPYQEILPSVRGYEPRRRGA